MDTLSQTVGQSSGQCHRQGHQFGGLGAGTAEHHTLVTGTANLIVGAEGNVSGLGMDLAKDLHSIGVETVTGDGIADLADDLAGNRFVVNLCLGGDLTADHTEVGSNHGLASNTGTGILGKTSIQDGVGNRVSHFVGMAAGNTFRSKQSFFH